MKIRITVKQAQFLVSFVQGDLDCMPEDDPNKVELKKTLDAIREACVKEEAKGSK